MPGSKSTANIFVALHAANGEAPEWINLLPAGVIATQDGRGPYTVSNMAALAAESMAAAGGKLPVDENHSTDFAAPSGNPSPARGWIVELQARADGLWGRVSWNASGKALFAEQAYRGISPVFQHDKAGRVLLVLRASLTNTPNLRDLVALHSESTTGANMDLLVELRKLLGLPEDADATAVIAKVKEINAAAGGAAAAQSQLKEIAKAAKVAETAEHSVVLSAVTTLATAAAQGADQRVTALQSELAAITVSHNTLQKQIATDRATAFVDKAIHSGRVGVKPLRDHYIEQHAKDPARVEKEINALPIVETTALTHRSTHSAVASDLDPVQIAAQATAYQKAQAAAGVTIDYASAVQHVTTTAKEKAQ